MEIKGITESKNLLRLLLMAALLRIIAGIRAYADKIGDSELAAKVNFTRTIHTMSDTAFLTASRVVLEVANGVSTDILPYGITNQILTDTNLDTNAFDSILKKPHALRSKTKGYTADLQKAVSVMTGELRDQMDNQVRSMFPGTSFATSYFNSRKTYNLNQTPTILRGNVKDANGHNIKNAIIEMIDYPSPGEITFRNTNANGNYAFKHISLANATLRVRALGFTTAEYSVKVTKNKTKDFNIQLLPEPTPVTITA